MKKKMEMPKKMDGHAAKTQKMHHEILKHHVSLMKSHKKLSDHLEKNTKRGK